nr:glucose-fructose oxidoreductase domain-containing protein 2 [Pogona vitticeps]
MKMLPGVGVFGTGSSARVLVPLLRAEGFSIEALWGKTEEEAKQLAEEMNISFYTSRTDDVLLHQDVDLVCIDIPPPLTRQIAVKALGNDELMGGGGLHTMGTYIIDLLTHLTSQKAVKVHGLLKTFVKQNSAISGIRHVTSDDFCFFQMLTTGGICSTVTLNFNMPGSFVHEVMIVGSSGRLIARGTDLYGQKNTASQEELLHADSLNVNAELSEKGFKDMPLLYLKGMVYLVQALRHSFQEQEDQRTWDPKPVAMAASFEDGLYMQSVVDAIKKSSRSGDWEIVELMTEEPDANQNLCEALQRNNL